MSRLPFLSTHVILKPIIYPVKNCIINKQTLQWNQEELWKTDFIYEYKTSKNFDFDKGINTLSKKTP